MYRLIYVIVDNGDGSFRNNYFESIEIAEKFIEESDWTGLKIPEGVRVDRFTLTDSGVLKPSFGFDD